MTYRASIVSILTWTLVILVFGWPIAMIACLPVLLFWNGEVLMAISMILVPIWVVLMWI